MARAVFRGRPRVEHDGARPPAAPRPLPAATPRRSGSAARAPEPSRFNFTSREKYAGASGRSAVVSVTNSSRGHRPQRVVELALLSDRRARLARDVAAAERPGAVRRIDRGRVGERQELLVERVVEQARELRRRHAAAEEIGPADVADEERVAGQDRRRLAGHRVIRDDDRDRLGRVAGRLEKAQLDRPHPYLVALVHGDVRELRLGGGAEVDLRARPLGELAVARHEVGVEVGLDDVPDRQPLRARFLYVDVHVAPRDPRPPPPRPSRSCRTPAPGSPDRTV